MKPLMCRLDKAHNFSECGFGNEMDIYVYKYVLSRSKDIFNIQ